MNRNENQQFNELQKYLTKLWFVKRFTQAPSLTGKELQKFGSLLFQTMLTFMLINTDTKINM